MPRLAKSTAAKSICLALACIYINHIAMNNVSLQTYLQSLEPKDEVANCAHYCSYFDVLKNIVVELDDSMLVIDEGKRRTIRCLLIEQQQTVLETLNDKGRELLTNGPISSQLI
jgi:hypothetical protein